MPLRKNLRKKRAAPKRKMLRKRKSAPKRVAKLGQLINLNTLRPKPQVFKKTALYAQNLTNVMVGAGTSVVQIGGALPSSMPDWSSIIALYNRYKMRKITYTFNLQSTAGATTSLYSYDLPRIFIRYNYDSNLGSGGVLAKLQECPNVKVHQFTPEKTTFSYSYYPHILQPVYLSALSTAYKIAPQQYIDIVYGTVPHYGIMWYVDNLTTSLSLTYDISWETSFKYQD